MICPEQFELVTEIKSLIDNFSPIAKEKDLSLSFRTEFSELYVKLDKYCLTKAIINLVENAIKYTSTGSVKVSLEKSGNYIDIKIVDTGIGIAEDFHMRLFEPFSQESTGFTKKFQGLGLGLSLTKKFCELCGGKISLTSQKGQGSTFTVSIPIPDDNEVIIPKDKKDPHPIITRNLVDTNSLHKIMILVVEDDEINQRLIKHYLKDQYHLKFADTVESGKKQLTNNIIDLVLLDISLKGAEDGLNLARFLRSTKYLNHIPILAITAHAFTSDRANAMAAGCNGFLTKPFKQANLIDKINEIL